MKQLLFIILLLFSGNIYSQSSSLVHQIDYVQFKYKNEEGYRQIQYVEGYIEVHSKTNDIDLKVDNLHIILEFTGDVEDIKDSNVKGKLWYYENKTFGGYVALMIIEDAPYIGFVMPSSTMYVYFKP